MVSLDAAISLFGDVEMLNRPRACDNGEKAIPQDVQCPTRVWRGHEVSESGGHRASCIETPVRLGTNTEKRYEQEFC